MKAFKNEIYWQCDLMAIKESNVACVQRRSISQYDSGERCGPWASCSYVVLLVMYMIKIKKKNPFLAIFWSATSMLGILTCLQ
jgi:hypothetical protein